MIHIRSELGKGTDVEVNLPLEKSDSSTNCSSMARSDIEVYGSVEAQRCVEELRKIAPGKTVAIIRDNASTTNAQTCPEPKWECIKKYFSTWFGFTIIDPKDRHILANVDLVIGEKDGNYLKSHLTEDMDIYRILLIRDGMTCVLERRSCSDTASVENIWHPIGPYKLARAVLGLFKNRPDAKAVVQNASLEAPSQSHVQASTPTPSSGTSTPISSTKQSMSEYSNIRHNEAGQASEDLPIRLASDLIVKPEPLKIPATTTTTICSDEDSGAAQALQNMQNMRSLIVPDTKPVSPESLNQTFAPGMLSPQIEDDTSLRVLAVDDNILNLQLLHRYLIKRPNDIVVTARNGVEAVAAVRQAKIPFDIILMDLSMPDMDGFEATRLIRVFEKSLKHREACEIEEHAFTGEHAVRDLENAEKHAGKKVEETEMPTTPIQMHAYIVALTGLASRRDRDEAEESGFDDFLTKPISFSKIGELLAWKSAEKGKREMSV
jgi:CheY-like chemotaxis protein